MKVKSNPTILNNPATTSTNVEPISQDKPLSSAKELLNKAHVDFISAFDKDAVIIEDKETGRRQVDDFASFKRALKDSGQAALIGAFSGVGIGTVVGAFSGPNTWENRFGNLSDAIAGGIEGLKETPMHMKSVLPDLGKGLIDASIHGSTASTKAIVKGIRGLFKK